MFQGVQSSVQGSRGSQSVQSVPKPQAEKLLSVPPSSHTPSPAQRQVSRHTKLAVPVSVDPLPEEPEPEEPEPEEPDPEEPEPEDPDPEPDFDPWS